MPTPADLGVTLPDLTQAADITEVHTVEAAIIAAMMIGATGPLSGLPSGHVVNRFYVVNDQGAPYILWDDGTSWSVLSSRPNIVTALPSSAQDGQMIAYQADAAHDVEWLFRYNAASASPYKWVLLGGSQIGIEAKSSSWPSAGWAVSSTGTPTTVQKAAAGIPTLTLPLAGDYEINASGVTDTDYVSIGTTAAGGTPLDTTNVVAMLGNHPFAINRALVTGVAAGTAITILQGNSTATSGLRSFSLSAKPIRVG